MRQKMAKQKMGTISLIVILASILVATIFSIYDYVHERERLRTYFRESTDPIVKRLATSLQKPLWFLDKNMGKELVRMEMMDKSVYAVVIREADKKTLFWAAKRDDNWEVVESEGDISGNLVLKREMVQLEGKDIGVLDVYFTTRFIEGVLKNLTIDILAKIIAMSLCLVIILSVVLHFFLAKPVSQVTKGLEDIAQGEGDLTRRLEIRSRDEIGELASCFNLFIGNLGEMIVEIAQNTNNLSDASEELASLSTQMALSADDMNAKSDSVAAASEEVTASVAAVASAAEQASASVSNIAAMTEEMSLTFTQISGLAQKTADNVRRMARSSEDMYAETGQTAEALEGVATSLGKAEEHTGQASRISHDASQRTKEINVRMDALSESSKQIGKIIGMIKDIADQTNMLALNAAIEAARAGEAGKGFAVVASEVKALAKQSADATEDIEEQIEHIQKSTNEAVLTIGEINKIITALAGINETTALSIAEQTRTAGKISKRVANNVVTVRRMADDASESANLVGEIAKSTDEASKTASEVAQNVDELARGVQEVATSCGEAATGVQDISRNIHGISTASKGTAADADQTSHSSKQLFQMAAALSEIVRRFKL